MLFKALYAALGLSQECHLWVLLGRGQMLLSIPALMFARSSQLKTCVPQISIHNIYQCLANASALD